MVVSLPTGLLPHAQSHCRRQHALIVGMSGHRGELQPPNVESLWTPTHHRSALQTQTETGRHRQQRWRSPPASQPAVMAIFELLPRLGVDRAPHRHLLARGHQPHVEQAPESRSRNARDMYGLPLWHDLLDQLRPHIVVISVADIIWRTSCSTHTAGGRSCTPSTGRRRHTALTPVPGPVPLVRCRRRPVPLRLLPGREDAPHYQRQPEARWAPSPARHGRAARSRLLLRSGNIP